MQKEWINIDLKFLNVIGIIKQLLTLFLGYMMFGKYRGCVINPWLLMLPSSFALGHLELHQSDQISSRDESFLVGFRYFYLEFISLKVTLY